MLISEIITFPCEINITYILITSLKHIKAICIVNCHDSTGFCYWQFYCICFLTYIFPIYFTYSSDTTFQGKTQSNQNKTQDIYLCPKLISFPPTSWDSHYFSVYLGPWTALPTGIYSTFKQTLLFYVAPFPPSPSHLPLYFSWMILHYLNRHSDCSIVYNKTKVPILF